MSLRNQGAVGATVPGMDVKVTAESTHYLQAGDWETAATGGGIDTPITVKVRRATRAEAEADFIPAWNEAAGTAWVAEEFVFETNEVDA